MKVHEGNEDYKCEPAPSQSNSEPGPSQSKIEPGPSQTDLLPVLWEKGNWQCPYCSYSHKRKDYVSRHIKAEHLGTKLNS